jgi:hypothetical protein
MDGSTMAAAARLDLDEFGVPRYAVRRAAARRVKKDRRNRPKACYMYLANSLANCFLI